MIACLLLCAVGCSDQLLEMPGETLVLVGKPPSGETVASSETLALVGGSETQDGFGDSSGTAPPAETAGQQGPGLQLTPGPGQSAPTDRFENAEHVLRVDFLNVGDADCILLRADDKVILVDTGESNDYQKISSTLTNYGISTIDCLIITHYDNDHIGSVKQLLTDYTVQEVYRPNYIRDSKLFRNFKSMLDICVANGKTVDRCLDGDVSLTLGYATLHIDATSLYAPGLTLGSDDSHALEENNYSLITTVTFGDVSLLLTGDAEGDRIKEFMAGRTDLDYRAIKIPHHGRYDKELGDLLRAAQGSVECCVVSVGSAGLVEPELQTSIYHAAKSQVYYTYDGDVRFVTDGSAVAVEQG